MTKAFRESVGKDGSGKKGVEGSLDKPVGIIVYLWNFWKEFFRKCTFQHYLFSSTILWRYGMSLVNSIYLLFFSLGYLEFPKGRFSLIYKATKHIIHANTVQLSWNHTFNNGPSFQYLLFAHCQHSFSVSKACFRQKTILFLWEMRSETDRDIVC